MLLWGGKRAGAVDGTSIEGAGSVGCGRECCDSLGAGRVGCSEGGLAGAVAWRRGRGGLWVLRRGGERCEGEIEGNVGLAARIGGSAGL